MPRTHRLLVTVTLKSDMDTPAAVEMVRRRVGGAEVVDRVRVAAAPDIDLAGVPGGHTIDLGSHPDAIDDSGAGC